MSAQQCAIISEISQDVLYNIVIVAKCLICFGGAVLLLRQWLTNGVQFLVHNNSRTLFHFYYGINFLLGIVYGITYLVDFVRLLFICVVLDFRIVLLLRGIGISATISAHHVLVLLSLERLYSSLFPSSFEKYSSRCLAIALALLVTAISTFYVFWNFTDSFRLFYEFYVALLDIKVRENHGGHLQTMFYFTISTALSMLIFFLDVYLNFYRKLPKDAPLAVSYQFSENRRVITTLLPIEIFDACFTILTSSAQLLYSMLVTNPTPVGRQLFLELTTFSVTYPLALAIIIEWRVNKRKQAIRPIDTDIAEIDYFKNLQTFWE